MAVRRIVPNVFDADPGSTRDFYEGVFDLDVVMDLGWIATLASAGSPASQLGVFRTDGEEGRDPFISIEVDDVDAVHDRAVEPGCDIVYSLRDEKWGVRRFMLRDPSGRVVNVLSHPDRKASADI
jgi:predicted enzyme related to lactoylglutathione lyase